jgi:hypothetical protein
MIGVSGGWGNGNDVLVMVLMLRQVRQGIRGVGRGETT